MRTHVITLAASVMLTAAACTLGPDPAMRPPSVADQAARFVTTPVRGEPELDRWWHRIGDPATAGLVDEALVASPDVLAAAARVLEAEATLAGARGARWPQAEYGTGASRQKVSFVLPEIGRIGIYSTTYSHDLTVSYQVDLFGRLARSQQATWAALLAAEADRRGVLNALAAQVVRTRAELAALERQHQLAIGTRESWGETLRIVGQRYRAGLAPAGDLHLTRQSQAAARAAVVELERTAAIAASALDVLLGRRPGAAQRPGAGFPELPDPEPPPPGLPAALLDRRPDLVSLRYRFSEAQARVGVALANLFPSLSLTAGAGLRGNNVAALSDTDSLVYNAVASIVAPIFSGGQRRSEVAAARARAEQRAAEYAGAVLVAFKEVEDALVAEALLREELAATEAQLDAARAAAVIAREGYRRGAAGILDLLIADRAQVTAESAVVSVRNQLWNARIGLIAALGGGWAATPATTVQADLDPR